MDTTTHGVTARSTPARVSLSQSHCSEPSVQSCSDETAATKTLPKVKLYQKGVVARAGPGRRARKGTPHSPADAVGPLFQ
jgi:hypothetical protein